MMIIKKNYSNSLPVKEGGLGVRRVTSLAPSAFQSSAPGTETCQQLLLLCSATVGSTDPTVTSVRTIWSSVHGLPCPSGDIAHRQSAWDKPVITSEREILTSSLSDSVDKAWLQAVRAIGCTHCLSQLAGYVWTTMQHTLQLVYVWVPTCEPYQCPCGAMTDAKGLHSRAVM